MKAIEKAKQMQLALEEKSEALEQTMRIIRVGLDALGARMLTTLALVGDFVLFAWFFFAGGWERLAAAVLFAIATWCLLNLKLPKERKPDET